MQNVAEAIALLNKAWPLIAEECRQVFGGELHYQAMIYHCLRLSGVPRAQLGMNVKQWITPVSSPLFKQWAALKREGMDRLGFEPIPDVVLFKPEIAGDWRRRRASATIRAMLLAIEVKASERDKGRLTSGEITRDIHKLAAHRDEVRFLGSDVHPVMMVIDTAPIFEERMRPQAVEAVQRIACDTKVSFFYVGPNSEISAWHTQGDVAAS